jgi:type II secretory pathway component PulF
MPTKKKFYKSKRHAKPVKLWGFPKERDYILENLALLLNSGIGVSESASIVRDGIKSKKLVRVLNGVIEDLDSGMMLWQSFEGKHVFEENYLNLIKVGEESGRLVENLKMIIAQQQKTRIFKAKLRAALAYPTIVFVLMILVLIGSSWFILPNIMVSFKDMNVPIPLITRVVMDFGFFLQRYGYIFVPSLAIFIITFGYLFFFNKRLRFVGQAFLMSIPGVKDILKGSEISRFGFVLGGLLESGLPVTKAVESLEETSPFRAYSKMYNHIKIKIDEGYSFQESFKTYKKSKKLIPNPIQQLIFAGERSGSLGEVLFKVSEIYDEKVDVASDSLSVSIEPILLFIVGLGVLFVGLSVILPIYTLTGSI